jgi:hypothetical protein
MQNMEFARRIHSLPIPELKNLYNNGNITYVEQELIQRRIKDLTYIASQEQANRKNRQIAASSQDGSSCMLNNVDLNDFEYSSASPQQSHQEQHFHPSSQADDTLASSRINTTLNSRFVEDIANMGGVKRTRTCKIDVPYERVPQK